MRSSSRRPSAPRSRRRDELSTTLVLVRHAEASCGVRRIVGGPRGDTGLTEDGRRHARLLRDRLLATGELAGATCLVSSVLPRAVETAETIAPAVGRGDLEPDRDCDLCELHPGQADGLTETELDQRFGRPDWKRDPTAPFAPDGESLVSFFERATGALRRLVESHPGQMVAVVTHGGVVEAAMVGLLGLPVRADSVGLDPAPCSMTWWSYDDRRARWRLERYNDAVHLLWRTP